MKTSQQSVTQVDDSQSIIRAKELGLENELSRGLDLKSVRESVPFPLPLDTLLQFKSSASLSGGISLQSIHSALDGTRKLVFSLNPGEGTAQGTVETVLIPMPSK